MFGGNFDSPTIKAQIKEYDTQINDENFWNDNKKSTRDS